MAVLTNKQTSKFHPYIYIFVVIPYWNPASPKTVELNLELSLFLNTFSSYCPLTMIPRPDSPIVLSTTQQFKKDFQYLLQDKNWEIENFVKPDDPRNSCGAFGIVASGKKKPKLSETHFSEPQKVESLRSHKHCVLKFVRQFSFESDVVYPAYGIATHADFHRELEIMNYVKDKIQSRNQLLPTRSLLKIYEGWITRKWGFADSYVEGVYVVEKLEGGDLFQFINDTCVAHGFVAEEYLRLILLPVFQAIKVLHDHRIVHNDLKIENLVFRDKLHSQLVIVDFGLAYQFRWPNETQIARPHFTCQPNGEPSNFSPEQRDPWKQHNGLNISPANDVYAMGYTLQKILLSCGHQCCESPTKFLSSHAAALIVGMMKTEVEERLTIDAVLESSWFKCNSRDLICTYCGARQPSVRPRGLSQSIAASMVSFEANKIQPRIRELRHALNSVKSEILINFAAELKEKMWNITGIQGPKIGTIVVTQFKEILGKCSGLAIFDSDALDKVIDINGDGDIDYREICLFLRTLGLFTTPQILSWFLLNLLDEDGKV